MPLGMLFRLLHASKRPITPTQFVGRAAERAELRQLLGTGSRSCAPGTRPRLWRLPPCRPGGTMGNRPDSAGPPPIMAQKGENGGSMFVPAPK